MQKLNSKQTPQVKQSRPSLLSRDSRRTSSKMTSLSPTSPRSVKSPLSPESKKSSKKPGWNDCVVIEQPKVHKFRPEPLKARSKSSLRHLESNKNESNFSVGTLNSLTYTDSNTRKINRESALMSPKRSGKAYAKKTPVVKDKFFSKTSDLNLTGGQASRTLILSPKRRTPINTVHRGTPLQRQSSLMASLAVTDQLKKVLKDNHSNGGHPRTSITSKKRQGKKQENTSNIAFHEDDIWDDDQQLIVEDDMIEEVKSFNNSLTKPMGFVKEGMLSEQKAKTELNKAEDSADEPRNINEELSKSSITRSAIQVADRNTEDKSGQKTATLQDTRTPYQNSASPTGPFHLHKQTASSLQYSASNVQDGSRQKQLLKHATNSGGKTIIKNISSEVIQFEADPTHDIRFFDSNHSSVVKLRADLVDTVKEENSASLQSVTPSKKKETNSSPSKSRFDVNLFNQMSKEQKSDSASTKRFVAPSHTYSPQKDDNQGLDEFNEPEVAAGTQELRTQTPKMISAQKAVMERDQLEEQTTSQTIQYNINGVAMQQVQQCADKDASVIEQEAYASQSPLKHGRRGRLQRKSTRQDQSETLKQSIVEEQVDFGEDQPFPVTERPNDLIGDVGQKAKSKSNRPSLNALLSPILGTDTTGGLSAKDLLHKKQKKKKDQTIPEENGSLRGRLNQLRQGVGPSKNSHRSGVWGDNYSIVNGGNGEEESETNSLRFNLSMTASAASDRRHFITSLSQHRRQQSVYSRLTSPKFAPVSNFFSPAQKEDLNDFDELLGKDENLETEEMQSERERHQATNSLMVKTAMSCTNRVKSQSVVAMGVNHRMAASSTTGTNKYFSSTGGYSGFQSNGGLGTGSNQQRQKQRSMSNACFMNARSQIKKQGEESLHLTDEVFDDDNHLNSGLGEREQPSVLINAVVELPNKSLVQRRKGQ